MAARKLEELKGVVQRDAVPDVIASKYLHASFVCLSTSLLLGEEPLDDLSITLVH